MIRARRPGRLSEGKSFPQRDLTEYDECPIGPLGRGAMLGVRRLSVTRSKCGCGVRCASINVGKVLINARRTSSAARGPAGEAPRLLVRGGVYKGRGGGV